MQTVTLQLDETLVTRAREQAMREGTTMDQVVNHALDQYTAKPSGNLTEFLQRVTAEGWRRPGTAMTDAEMYGQ